MATLLLTAVGTAVGGPIGGAIGAIAGRSIDGAVFGGGRREGPRLKELAVSTSSYGTPLPQHFGRMRAAGCIIWATDLVEHSESSGGGKGKPKTTSFAYSTSFAVALASRPIRGVGRIWADGNLLRGAAGDLKPGGTLRIHTGHGDQSPDPLIASAEGDCPAFRNRAYAVFEDLALADFGNRIPALTFEIIADDGSVTLTDILDGQGVEAGEAVLPDLSGFSNEGGTLLETLDTLDSVYPLACDAGGATMSIGAADSAAIGPVHLLPEAAAAWEDGDFGAGDGQSSRRDAEDAPRPDALRYYDTARDFQPGVQRAGGRARPGRTRTIEFPGALGADAARTLAAAAAQRAGWRTETLSWRMAELDPAIAPGSLARAPGVAGLWRVAGWEWRDRGVELELVRQAPVGATAPAGDPGFVQPPVDALPAPTRLHAFEVPSDGFGPLDSANMFAAASAPGPKWSGAALYVERAGELIALGPTGRRRSTLGVLTAALAPSAALMFEREAVLDVELVADDLAFLPAGIVTLATGANRLLVGSEVIQFAAAEQRGERQWRLTGLLRGRGGTEPAAQAGQAVGAPVVLLDDTLVPLDPALVPPVGTSFVAAIGRADEEPVFATLSATGAGRKPPCPVHGRTRATSDGGLDLRWTRRARGAWDWPDEVDAPLVEQGESYTVGAGPLEAPFAQWTVAAPALTLAAEALAQLRAHHPGAPLWVRQTGTFALSDPLLLTFL